MQALFLIQLSGRTTQAHLSKVFLILENHLAVILDIEQNNIFQHIGFSVLISLPKSSAQKSLFIDIEAFCKHENIIGNIQSVTPATYEQWITRGGKQKQIIVLLAKQLKASALSALLQQVHKNHFQVDSITRLSGRSSLTQSDARIAFEIVLTEDEKSSPINDFHAEILKCSQTLGVDISVQAVDKWRHLRRLVCFDMDSTLIQIEVIDEISKAAGVYEQVKAITEQAMQGKCDFIESFNRRMALLKGVSVETLEKIALNLPLTHGTERLINTLKQSGFKTAILSGGFDFFAEHLQQQLGFDFIFANKLEIVNGKLTGRVLGDIVDGKAKARHLKKLASTLRLDLAQVVAVGDGANDIPMLSLAGLGIAFQAKPLVLEKTRHHLTHFGIDGVLYLLGLKDECV